jgi:hypothetical protein
VQRALLIILVAASYALSPGYVPGAMPVLLSLTAVAVLVAPLHTLSFPKASRGLDFALIAILLVLIIQIVPLPIGVVQALSPHVEPLRQTVRITSFATPSAWQTLSVDATATTMALATTAIGIATFWIARSVFGTSGGTRVTCRFIAIIAAVAAVTAVVQKALEPKLVLGLFVPEARSTNPFGAFTNRNHMAGWLMMNAAIVGGYLTARLRTHPAYRARQWSESFREFLASGALLTAIEGVCIVGVMLATLSRSAVAGSAAALVYGWHAGRPRLRVERMRVPTIAALIVLGILGGLLFIDVQAWMGRLGDSFGQSETGGFGRISIWRETLPIVRDFWLAGTGGGTFSDAMMRYQQSHVWVNSMQRWAHFNNAHSHYIQVIAEGGVLLAIPVATALTMFWKLGRRSVRADKGEMFWVRIGALAGLVGLAVQSVWEVSLVMPANAVMAGVLGGLVLYRRDPNSRTDKDMAKAA